MDIMIIKQIAVITQPILTELKMMAGTFIAVGTIYVSRSGWIHEAIDYIGDIGTLAGAFASVCLAIVAVIKLKRVLKKK